MENNRAVSRRLAITDGVTGKFWTACLAASTRIKALAVLAVIRNFGAKTIIMAVSRKFLLPLNYR
nr:K778 [uncultured bacterium]